MASHAAALWSERLRTRQQTCCHVSTMSCRALPAHSSLHKGPLALCSLIPLMTFSFRAVCASIMCTSSLNCPTAGQAGHTTSIQVAADHKMIRR